MMFILVYCGTRHEKTCKYLSLFTYVSHLCILVYHFALFSGFSFSESLVRVVKGSS